ncbi:MAG: hypothetical protein ACRCST_11305 [Turicibacter sp.]
MNTNYHDYYWSKLDNVAKLYSLVSSSKATNVFRFSAKMSEQVEPTLLAQAIEAALRDMPSFKVKLRAGLFWYYFEMNNAKPKIREDYTYPCSKITKFTNSGYLFNITYYEQLIHLEVFHVLADGAGAMQFFKLILFYYLRALHPEQIPNTLNLVDEGRSQQALDEDSFRKVSSDTKAKIVPSATKSYEVDGVRKNYPELKVIHGIMPARDVVRLAKEKGVTLTGYLAALLIYSIYIQNFKFSKDKSQISVCVPVDLRNQFDSKTIRNFFANMTLTLDMTDNMTFDDILVKVSQQLIEEQNVDAMSAKIHDHVSAQENVAIRFVPLFIKDMVMRYIYRRADKGFTTTLSNLGRVMLPAEMAPFVEEFRVMISVTPHQPLRSSVCSLGDKLVYSFSSALEETDVQKFFFRFLQQQGIDITISSNEEINYEILS